MPSDPLLKDPLESCMLDSCCTELIWCSFSASASRLSFCRVRCTHLGRAVRGRVRDRVGLGVGFSGQSSVCSVQCSVFGVASFWGGESGTHLSRVTSTSQWAWVCASFGHVLRSDTTRMWSNSVMF